VPAGEAHPAAARTPDRCHAPGSPPAAPTACRCRGPSPTPPPPWRHRAPRAPVRPSPRSAPRRLRPQPSSRRLSPRPRRLPTWPLRGFGSGRRRRGTRGRVRSGGPGRGARRRVSRSCLTWWRPRACPLRWSPM
jgi:hypothetical protein